MALTKDIAIVLRRLDYSETSQVLAMFTRSHGQPRVIAKGIKRGTKNKAATGIDLLEMGDLVLSMQPGKEQNLAPLTDWAQLDNFHHLRGDLIKHYAAQYAAEVTTQLTESHDPHPALFDGLHQFLLALKTDGPLPSLVKYLLLMLTEIGLRPEFSRCVSCQRDTINDDIVYFSSREGGVICRDCEPAIVEKTRISPKLARALQQEEWLEPLAREGFDLLDYHLREIMARPAKLSSLLRGAVGLPLKF